MDDSLIDPSLLASLTPEQRQEALAAAAAANRAEERAEQRALERALAKRAAERQTQQTSGTINTSSNATPNNPTNTNTTTATTTTINPQIKFVSKRQRQQQKEEEETEDKPAVVRPPTTATLTTAKAPTPYATSYSTGTHNGRSNSNSYNNNNNNDSWTDKERQAIRQTYLGKTAAEALGRTAAAAASAAAAAATPHRRQDNTDNKRGRGNNNNNNNNKKRKEKPKTMKGSKKTIFRFEWDNTDDTLDQSDPLYNAAAAATPITNTHKNAAMVPKKKKQKMDPLMDTNNNNNNNTNRNYQKATAWSVQTKPLDQMTSRDWRIFRENYEIVVKGGRAPPPLRSFREGNVLNPSLLNAIENVLGYKDPTPIQRQAIPIGLERRDLIGIAETGSGKTAAFGVPLLQYIQQLSPAILARVADDGPLALVLAPTRELALQIHGEFQKLLSRQSNIRAAVVVGGQSIQHQAQEIREGVHVVVGTPGRINDCIEMAYMVLNQCCYIVLDEADRMIDMGFAPQMESILDAMGGLLKSENEDEAYKQEEDDRTQLQAKQGSLPRHRLTAMFSATMPLEVERMAKRYLRHPAVISIGDQDSSKNNRIVQRILFLSSPSQKEKSLRDLITDPRFMREKVIVFVNEKKHADGVARMVERFGRPCVVLHGGKNQEQREENLAKFRQGGVVLVATDVAGRGLDIPNVAHIINFDMPTRSIDTYNHRIGRTGRAGKQGWATSLLTEDDVGILAPLKQYLESTGQPIPDKLARHPAANANGDRGNLIY
jgi:ATP-dependent RNA helicase DDX23/PRP28